MGVQLCSDKQCHKSNVVGFHVWHLSMAALRGLLRLQVKNDFPNTWPSDGEPSWVLSFICFARPEGQLLRTYYRVLVLHPCRLLAAARQPRLFSQMTLPLFGCVRWIWEVHTRKCPLSTKDCNLASTDFILVSSEHTLKTIHFWILLSKAWSYRPLKMWVSVAESVSPINHLILFGGLWCFAVSPIAMGSFYLQSLMN